MSTGDRAKKETKKVEQLTGVKWCSSHNSYRPLEGGKFLKTKSGQLRWICAHCVEKRPERLKRAQSQTI